jgi:hypothetical protein
VGDSKLAFKLDLPPRMKIHPVFHASLLEPYHSNTLPGRTQPPAPPVIVDGKEGWEVDRVLDSRIYRGRLEYYVSWKDYGPADNGWEPAAHLENCPGEVAQLHPPPESAFAKRSSDPTCTAVTAVNTSGLAGARHLEGAYCHECTVRPGVIWVARE